MKLLMQAVITRQWTSRNFALHKLVPSTPGAPAAAEMAEMFGEADRCVMDGTAKAARSEEQDRRFYPYLRLAIINLAAMDVPMLDFGFQRVLSQLASDLQSFEANATPMNSVTRDICKMFLNSHRRRNQDLSAFPADEGDGLFSYVQTPALVASRTRLLLHTRETMADDLTNWMHHYHRMIAATGGQPAQRQGPPTTPARTPTGLAPAKATDRSGTPAVKKEPPARADHKATEWQKIDHTLWREAYGDTDVGKICFFHANRPGGCTKSQDECGFSHGMLPERYDGKAFDKLSMAKRTYILGQCKRP
jgi:hypothetical protein